MIQALTAHQVVVANGVAFPGVVLMEDGVITAAGARAEITIPSGAQVQDFDDAVLAPGFVDVHVHGGAGCDVMHADARQLEAFRLHLARHGVTGFLATTMSAPWPQVLEAVRRLRGFSLGLHTEGPFISPQRPGIHPVENLLLPTLERLDQLWEACDGQLKLVTVAPELAGAIEFIQAARARGVRLSLGHSDADFAQAKAGFEAGGSNVTHTFNAMRPLHHRDPGLLGFALSDREHYAEIIADGEHVDPSLVAMFVRLKGIDRAILVSDGISATGCPEGKYVLGTLTVDVANGRCMLGGHLAGSVLTLDRAVRNVAHYTGWPLAMAAQLASRNPARMLGLERKGQLAAGSDADIVVLSPQGNVVATYIGGEKVN